MSRRNQSHRRRTYGRRQHEVRERRPEDRGTAGLLGDTETEFDGDWQAPETTDERAAFGDSYGGFGR
jgi:hypothetical protein